MADTTAPVLNLRIDGRALSFEAQKPVSVGAHRYCNVVLPVGGGETPPRAAVFEWKNGAWVLSNTSPRPFLLRAQGQPAQTLPSGGSVALAGKPFVLMVAGAPAATVEVSEGELWVPDTAVQADLDLFAPWAGEDPVRPPPVESQRLLIPPPAPAWGFPGATPALDTRRGLVTALFVAISLVASAAGAAAWHGVARGPVAPPHPAQWDPRLADIVSFVENERGLTFRHPVFVDYLEPQDLRQKVVAAPEQVSGKERRALEHAVSFFRALGLVEGTPDLVGGTNQLSGDGILAYYDPTDQRVRVRGTELTEAVKATLAHELTHALQDQHFNLSRMGESDDAVDRFRAVVEGDAMRVQTRWVQHLDSAALKAHDAGRAGETENVDFSAVPEVLTAMFSAPYDLGGPFVELLHAVGGNAAVDRVLMSPPASEEQLIDPFRYLDGDRPLQVKDPVLHKGETRIDGGQFGAFGLYLVLAQRLDPRVALGAVDGWGGDSYVQFDAGGRSCVRGHFVGDNPQETEELAATFESWARAMPPATASVARLAGQIEVSSCDPGAGAKIGGLRLADAIGWPVARTYTALGAIQAGATQDAARCYSGELIEAFTPEQLAELPSAAQERRMATLAAACQHH